MNYLSVCSGIEAATVAWHPLGYEPVAFSEIEKFPAQVLDHHYPKTPNWGDMTKFKEWPDATINVLVGGTPCQSFSVAGLRKGLDDPRGNLMLTYLAIADKYRPEWLVWENVPGVLSSNGGLDFASLLRGMGECGYGFAYRILDAQYFGVAQRRRRVFVVGCLGGWQRAAAVLFERHSLQGHLAPRREKREEVAPTVTRGVASGGTVGQDEGMMAVAKCLNAHTGIDYPDRQNYLVWPADTTPTLDAHYGDKQGLENQHINGGGGLFVPGIKPALKRQGDAKVNDEPIAFSGQMSNPQTDMDITQTLGAKNPMAVACVGAFKPGQSASAHSIGYENEMAPTLEAGEGGNNKPAVHVDMQVRRLTPVECERLQGFPDGYTDIKLKGKPTPDGPRYKALGNSMAVPVMRWIGERIKQVGTTKQNRSENENSNCCHINQRTTGRAADLLR